MNKTAEVLNYLARSGILSESQARQQLSLVKGDPLCLLSEIVHEQPHLKEQLGKVWGDLLNVAYVNLDRTLVNYEIVRLFPREFALESAMVPIVLFGDVLTVACARPEERRRFIEAENYINTFISPVFSFPEEIENFIELAYQSAEHLAELLSRNFVTDTASPEQTLSREALEGQAGQKGVIDFIDGLVMLALKEGATDVHIEPSEKFIRIRFRIDGVLHEKLQLENNLLSPVVSRIKILSSLDISERRRPQDGRYEHKLTTRSIDIRVAVIPAIHGEKIVLRLLGHSNSRKSVPDMVDLGLSFRIMRSLHEVSRKKSGIFFVTGPTGSGKTTTLFSLLNMLNDETVNIMTVEDPVEYRLDRINQIQVNSVVGLTFSNALRSFLRQDPDIILVGEIRDEETARIAVQAALTGHLVLATLHTNSALQAVGRLVDIGVEPFLAAPAAIGVMAQRLVRRICDECRESYPAPREEVERYFHTTGDAASLHFSRGAGCRKCNHTGYRGQVAIAELFIFDDRAQRIIARNTSPGELTDYAISQGYKEMLYDGLLKVACGITTLSEVERVLGMGETAVPRELIGGL